jgi:RNA polymerase sigma-70 factor (ECF subfamily)
MPFDEIAPIVERSPQAARQLASRARRRVRSVALPDGSDLAAQRAAVDAFLAASRDGDFDALIAVLHPDVVYRADRGAAAGGSVKVRGAGSVAGQAVAFSQRGLLIRPVLINGTPGVISSRDGRPFSVIGFTVTAGKITEIDVILDQDRLRQLDLSALGDQWQ